MATIGGHNDFGLFGNGDLRDGTNRNFTLGTYQSSGGPDDSPYIRVTGGGGSTYLSTDYIEVDTTKNYQMVMYAKTFSRGTDGNLAGGHIGYATYDKNKDFIYLNMLGGIGNTTLSRAASAGDTTIYITDNSSWYNGSAGHARYAIFYPPSDPDYSTAYEYTRHVRGYSEGAITSTAQGDYAVALTSAIPSSFGSLPIGTPVSNGQHGGTFSYALGAPNYPETWTRYATNIFTGESRNSGTPFRYGTKYIRFMILKNYNRRTAANQDHVWGISKMFFGRSIGGRDYRNIL